MAKQTQFSFLKNTHPAIKKILQGSTDLPTFLATAGMLSLTNRKRIVEQAMVLVEANYVHLPLKESMHGINPLQRLRLLQHQLERQSNANMPIEFSFHREMLDIFNSFRDLHTNYLLPQPFQGRMAFMPFDIEECYEDDQPIFLATHFVQGFSHSHFKVGVEVISWNGVPIDRAVTVNGDRNAGSNSAARRSRGIEGMTVRSLTGGLPPDEAWVVIGYRGIDGQLRELRQPWIIAPSLPDLGGVEDGRAKMSAAALGIDRELADIRRAKAMLFAPDAIVKSRKKVKLSNKMVGGDESVASSMGTVFRAKSVVTPSGEFGYVRIFTFDVNDPVAFIEEFVRIVSLLPQNGLIIDVRGNGGGHIWASEGLLQTLTPMTIEPEPTQFVNSPLNLRLCKRHASNPVGIDLQPWIKSIEQSVTTGAVYSQGFPITPPDFANEWGQQYHGPVLLITDARCYSATDIFAAGFQDHDIGDILGVEANTGAGGANVWTHELLRELLRVPEPADAESPYRPLPGGANLRVSIRRTLRVGERSGTPVEDLGVEPSFIHPMTRSDVLDSNVDLIAAAGEILATQTVYRLDVGLQVVAADIELQVDTLGLRRLDIYVDGRPQSWDVTNGLTNIVLPSAANAQVLDVWGYDGTGAYVAFRKVFI